MTINIPNQLQDSKIRFCLLKEKTKIPFEKDWQNKGYKFNDDKLLKHIENGGNYGVIGGKGNLRIIDIDNKEEAEKLSQFLNTFTIETGNKGRHFYIYSDYEKNHVFKNNLGELRADNYQVAGPNSIHPNGNKYNIINNIEIINIKGEDLIKILLNFLKEEEISQDIQIEKNKEYLEKNILKNLGNLTYSLITKNHDKESLNSLGFKSRSERDQKVITTLILGGYGQYIKSIFELYPVGNKYKEHPAKEGYLDFSIKGARKYSGVLDNYTPKLQTELENISEKVLRNKVDEYLIKILKVNNWALQQYFISTLAFRTRISKIELLKRLDIIKNSNKTKNPIAISDLMKKDMPKTEYWMYPIIPKNSLILIGGKPGTFKSMFILAISLCMKTKSKFIENFETKEVPKILLYDLENGEELLRMRLEYLKEGLKCDVKDLGDFHVELDFNKANIEKELELAKDYDIIILDSYRRFLEGTENDSEVTTKFFEEFSNKLKMMNKTVIILHHFKKTKLEELTDDDIMDLFRGSSDIPAQFDLILGMFKTAELMDFNGEKTTFDVSLIKAKNRKGLPIQDFKFRVVKNDADLSTSFYFLDYGKLQSPKERIKERIIEKIREMEGGLHRTKIVEIIKKDFSCSESSIYKYLEELVIEKLINRIGNGVYSLQNNNTPNIDLKDIEEVLKDGKQRRLG